MPDQAQGDQAGQDLADLAVRHMGPTNTLKNECSENVPPNPQKQLQKTVSTNRQNINVQVMVQKGKINNNCSENGLTHSNKNKCSRNGPNKSNSTQKVQKTVPQIKKQ